ncbi:MAG TPA: HIT family protein [Phycisphaerales bacterium]|nr:HIT family protein [Phycisphaerales bacterium]
MRIATLRECDILLSENQGCRGWCVCVLREHAEHMADMPRDRQARIFDEVARVAGAIRAVFARGGAGAVGDTGPPRINYECLGNVTAHVHWHVIPRHADDPTPRDVVWKWTPDRLRGDTSAEERRALAARLRVRL